MPGLISALLHGALLAALILRWPGGREGIVPAPDTPPTVKLVMVEQKGADPTTASPAPSPTPPSPQTSPSPPLPKPPPPQPPPPQPPPPQQAAPAEAASPPRPHPTVAKAAPAKPVHQPPARPAPALPAVHPAPQAAPQHAPVQMNLGGNNPDTNAIVSGPQVVPASPDAAYTNRQPAYPIAAARRGEQGAVLLIIHVLPDGRAGAVEVAGSSGYPALDQAAVNAVRRWHFLPALKDGQPVESQFPFRVVFQLN